MAEFSNIKVKDVLKHLHTSEKGLSNSKAKSFLRQYGLNEIKHEKKISPLEIFINQFKSFVIMILIAATIISVALEETLDATVIGIILIVNAGLGFIWEYRAEKSIEALKKMASLSAVVIRDGKEQKIDAKEVVPGDIIMLETGEKVPADARLIKLTNLQTQEAALTGESLPIKKNLELIATKTIGDMKNMVFAGTIVTAGHAIAAVTSTAMNTEIGKIANLIQQTPTELTPLQKKLDAFGRYLGIATIIISLIVFGVGTLFGKPVFDMLLTSVALAVAAIPEGLPIVVTIALALGTQRMVKRNALIRKLPSVETLGSTTVICTDKTGTLTHNEMTVKKIFVDNGIIKVSGSGYETKGMFSKGSKIVDAKKFQMLLKIGALCNNAKIGEKVIGDPTEAALLVSAAKSGLTELAKKYPRVDELEFDSERKMMSTIHKTNGKKVQYTKGAPDVIVEKCDRILINGQVKRLTRIEKKNILNMNSKLASEALRVLGFAYKDTDKIKEDNMIFVGLQGMIDPPREEAKLAIQKCKNASIKVVMITGDFKATAVAIGKELGLAGKAIDGKELDSITDLDKVVEDIVIYARVNPEHKIRIVEALKKKGHIVAMTGDGVNDAPALKKADIGIAMGITGTDVAKEASEMILTDDNFASIVNAVEEGRGVYDNIKKFVQYLLSSNLGEILVLFLAIIFSPFFGGILPLSAIQILWINLLTDGLPATALAVDPLEEGIMERKPRKESILNKYSVGAIVVTGILIALGTLFLFKLYLPDVQKAVTMAFTTLVMFQIVRLQVVRMDYKVGIFSNTYLILAVISSILLQFAVIYIPFLSNAFKTTALGIWDWAYIILVSLSVLVLGYATRLIRRLFYEKSI